MFCSAFPRCALKAFDISPHRFSLDPMHGDPWAGARREQKVGRVLDS
jgi:hypothetical protein